MSIGFAVIKQRQKYISIHRSKSNLKIIFENSFDLDQVKQNDSLDWIQLFDTMLVDLSAICL